jgi:hypothetical protein
MSQSSVLTFSPSHVGFADNLVTIRDELRINQIAIGDPKVTGPVLDAIPQGRKGGRTVVSNDPI